MARCRDCGLDFPASEFFLHKWKEHSGTRTSPPEPLSGWGRRPPTSAASSRVASSPKRAAPNDLISAIRSVHGEGAYLHPTAARALISDYMRRVPTGEEKDSYDGLTEREREVLRLIAEGLPSKDIAEKLGISVSTVERHRPNIMEKLNLHTRTALVKIRHPPQAHHPRALSHPW